MLKREPTKSIDTEIIYLRSQVKSISEVEENNTVPGDKEEEITVKPYKTEEKPYTEIGINVNYQKRK